MIEVYSLMLKNSKEVLAITENLADMAQAITDTEQEYVKDNLEEQWFGGTLELQEALNTLEQETAIIENYMAHKLKKSRYHFGNLVEGLDFYAGEYVVQAFTLYITNPSITSK